MPKFGKKGKKPVVRKTAIMKKVIHDYANPEINSFTQVAAAADVTSTITIVHLSAVASGSDYNQRVGNEIKPKYLDVKCSITAGAAVQNMRVLVLQGNVANGTLPTFAQLFNSTSTALSTLLSPFNEDNVYIKALRNKGRPIKVLYDKLIPLEAASDANPTKKQILNIRIGEKRMKPVVYVNNTGADYANSGIFLMFYGDTAANVPQLGYDSTLYYTA